MVSAAVQSATSYHKVEDGIGIMSKKSTKEDQSETTNQQYKHSSRPLASELPVWDSGRVLLENEVDDDSEEGIIRTATGGFIYTVMVTLTVIAFLSNGAFLVYVFWLSK